MIKTIYFDEEAAKDYIDIMNNGEIKISETLEEFQIKSSESKSKVEINNFGEKLKKIGLLIFAISISYLPGFLLESNILKILFPIIIGVLSSLYFSKEMIKKAETKYIRNGTVVNTLLTDYIKMAKENEIRVFKKVQVKVPENSISFYKMYSPYSILIPNEENINVSNFDLALESARGYYEMILELSEETVILRFNIKAFRNNYKISDITKMNLTYYTVGVGKYAQEKLDINKEFQVFENNTISAEEALNTLTLDENNVKNNLVDVYDVVLAGVSKNV